MLRITVAENQSKLVEEVLLPRVCAPLVPASRHPNFEDASNFCQHRKVRNDNDFFI